MEAGKKHFPQVFWTTFSGGLQNIDKVDDWGVLNAFKTIVLWSDADNGSREEFLLLAQMLNDKLDSEVKIVDLPRNLPKDTWDLANKRNDDGIDIHSGLASSSLQARQWRDELACPCCRHLGGSC